ncbi:MAG: hypothetical protein EBZ48_17095 [Proteobacteria bacterium]|nr:hypothetical protein [Pseudomonadota bacterium]
MNSAFSKFFAYCGLVSVAVAQEAVKFPREAAWPDVVRLTQPSTLTGVGGKVMITKPVGTEVDAVLSPDHATLVISVKDTDFRGSVPVDKTDFMQRATAKEEQMHKADLQADIDIYEAQKAEGKKLEDKEKSAAYDKAHEKEIYGHEPYWCDNGISSPAIPTLVMRNMRRRLNDPDSLRIRSVAKPIHADYNGTKCWRLNFTFSARNAFGGMTTQKAVAWVREDRLLDLSLLSDSDVEF